MTSKKGLKGEFEKGDRSKIVPNHEHKFRARLQSIDTAWVVDDLNLAEYRIHKLKGERKEFWVIPGNDE